MDIERAAHFIAENVMLQYSKIKPLKKEDIKSLDVSRAYVIDLCDTYYDTYNTAKKRLSDGD